MRKEFRSDLFNRLNVFPILLPPLLERADDIPALVVHFVEIYGCRMSKQIDQISPETMSVLSSYPSPGNIPELQNFIERSVMLTDGTMLDAPLSELGRSAGAESREAVTLKDAERDHILRTLRRTSWVVAGPNGAAARLGMKRSTLYSRMQKLGISRLSDDFISA
jgi:formate hydrogenlyase transcriptional activator